MKYALLHCSYSAPVTVCETTSDTPSIAALTIDVALLGEVVWFFDTEVVVAMRGVVLVLDTEIVLRDEDGAVLDCCVCDALETVVALLLRVVVVESERLDGLDVVVAVRETKPCPV